MRRLRVYRMIYAEKNGQYIFGIVFEDEDIAALINLGNGRRKDPSRWMSVTQRGLKDFINEGLVRYIDVSLKAATYMTERGHHLLDYLMIRDAVRKRLESRGLYNEQANRSESLRRLESETPEDKGPSTT